MKQEKEQAKTQMKQKGTKSAMGLRVETDQLKPQLIQVDSSFEKCPIAHAAGIPLYVKRLLNEPRKKGNNYIIVRMMSSPSQGLAPIDWQYGGSLEPAPPVLVARNDGIQFNENDWAVLDDLQIEMLDDGPRNIKRKDFISFVKSGYKQNTSNIVLEVLYPKGTKCKVSGLVSNVELNGKVGICNGVYQNKRLGVEIEELQKTFAISPKNIQPL